MQDSNRKLTTYSIIAVVVLQVVTIVSGFILPSLILSYFGSEVNGLVSSISQFLNYITLLEGGISGVVMAALYKSLAVNDFEKVNRIISSVNSFFRKIALIYIGYALCVAIIYPLFTKAEFSYWYVFSLVIVLTIGTFIQYFFALTYRILLNADRRGFIVSISQSAFVVANLILVFLSLKIYPSIHLLKTITGVTYFLQPVVYTIYVKKHYPLLKKTKPDPKALEQRWDGFGQNLAFFIHTNTDVIILTIFTNLATVSIYSVYTMITYALKGLISSISNSIGPSFGNVLVSNDSARINKVFDYYEAGVSAITTFSFSCCAILIVPFIAIYTKTITDANYYQPFFGLLIAIADGLYCLRSPYVNVAYTAGHYKKTSIFAYLEASINIVVSLSLVFKFGLIGIAIGTLSAMFARMIFHIIYNKKNILFRSVLKSLKNIAVFFIVLIGSYFLTKYLFSFEAENYFEWFIVALKSALIVLSLQLPLYAIFHFKTIKSFFLEYILRKRKTNEAN